MSYSIIQENMGRKNFFAGKLDFFSKICVFNNLLGVTEKIL